MRKRAIVALALVAASVALLALPAALAWRSTTSAPRFEVLAHADPGLSYLADVYGHGNFAYLSSYHPRSGCPGHGVLVYDLRDPPRPRLVSRFARVRGTWTEKTIVKQVRTAAFKGTLAVTSFQRCAGGFQGFGLYDVTNPKAPRQLAMVRTDPLGSHEIWLAAVGNRAYVYTAILASEIRSSADGVTPGRPDFRIFDVSNPRRPTQVGEWGAWRQLGLHPTAGGRVNLVHSVTTNRAGTRAYLSYWDLGTVILDISRPSQPRYLGRTELAEDEEGRAHSVALDRSERVLIETHEEFRGRPTLFDVSDASRPVRLGTFDLTEAALVAGRRGEALSDGIFDGVHDPDIAGDVAFFSWYAQGVVAADFSDPSSPQLLARFLPPRTGDRDVTFCPGRRCTSIWGVYVTPKYVLASDMVGGLWVLRFSR